MIDLPPSVSRILLKLCALTLASVVWAQPVQAQLRTELLVDRGFNSSSQSLQGYWGDACGRWMRKFGRLVGSFRNLQPFEGDGMIMLSQNGRRASSLRQRIDVSRHAAAIDNGGIIASGKSRMTASALGVRGGMLVAALDRRGNQLCHAVHDLHLDGAAKTWQRSAARLRLPKGTRFVEVRFQFTNDTETARRLAFVDAVSLMLR